MLTYLFIGLIVQLVIVGWRLCLNKTGTDDVSSYGPWAMVGFMVAFLLMSGINVLVWPISIIAEIVNTIKGY